MKIVFINMYVRKELVQNVLVDIVMSVNFIVNMTENLTLKIAKIS